MLDLLGYTQNETILGKDVTITSKTTEEALLNKKKKKKKKKPLGAKPPGGCGGRSPLRTQVHTNVAHAFGYSGGAPCKVKCTRALRLPPSYGRMLTAKYVPAPSSPRATSARTP